MKATSAIKKGKELENYIVDQIRAKGLDIHASRSAGSGNGTRDKGDIVTSFTILGQNAGIEAKNQKSLAIPEWWKQTRKLEPLGMEPVLVFKMKGEGYQNSLALVYLETFLELCKRSSDPKTDNPTRKIRSTIASLRSKANTLKKKFDKEEKLSNELFYAIEDFKKTLSILDRELK